MINFDAGITGIVGPNGCGKSNIVDALIWVMGEQSAKHLRGTSMEDVIFNGSENFAPLGMAEVSLTLENEGGPFPAKWIKHSEIMITRRLHRSGESEYFINKEICRLKDIVDIFMDTGAGSKGFSIIEQGQIGKIITAKPEDRRVLIEEAAGITKFKVRKRESQRKLEGTEQNLVRLNDIIGELRRQLESLQRQAKRAERYKELKTQAQDLDLWISSKKFTDLQNEARAVTEALEDKKLAEQETRTRYSQIMADLQNLKLELLECERKVTSSQGAHFEWQTQVQRKESEIQLLQMEIDSTKRNEEITGTLKSEVGARRDILSRDKLKAETSLEESGRKLVDLASDAAQKTELSANQVMKAREVDEKLTQVRRDLMSVIQSLTAVEVRINSLADQQTDVAQRLGGAEAVHKELRHKQEEFGENRKRAFNALETQRQMQLAIMNDVKNFEENLNLIKTEAEQKRLQLQSFKDDYNQVISRLYGLETLNANFEGLQEGVKQVMTWQRERLQPLADGGFELVADVVEVPKDYELAMEAALGDRLQSVLTPTSQSSMTAVELLKERKAGRSSFISTDWMSEARSPEHAEGLKNADGVRGFLADLVRCPDRHQKVLAHILDGMVVVDTLGTALRLRSDFPGYSFVTLEGDVLSQDGTLTGGSSDSADSGLLRQKREIKELSLRKDEASGKLALATATLEKLEAQVSRVSKDLEASQKQNFEQEIIIHDRKKDLERSEAELANVDEALRRQGREVEGLRKQLEGITQQQTQAELSAQSLREQKTELEGASGGLESELETLKGDQERLSLEATEAQVRVAAQEQIVESLKQHLARMGEQLREAEEQISRMSEDSSRNSETLSANILKLEQAKVDVNNLVDQTRLAEEAVKTARDQFEQISAQARELEQQAGTFSQQNNQLNHEISEAQVKQSQAQLNEKYLVDQILERYMLDLIELAPQYAAKEGDLEQNQLALDDLRDKLKKIGEVNLTAIQEYEQLTQRYEFLTKQQQDLVSAMDSLRKVIDRINRICNRRFRETYEAVNERFKKVFPVLFGGGEAQLILIENPEAGEPGVEIMARPPGKKLQSVTLLSGGEKALTAVSLIFAIFLFKPSPFCLLDEVDAPLDDANVYRFNDLVKEMARRSQVILVTHNKHTMEINNTLYGVTMEDPGVSKMVSVRLEA